MELADVLQMPLIGNPTSTRNPKQRFHPRSPRPWEAKPTPWLGEHVLPWAGNLSPANRRTYVESVQPRRDGHKIATWTDMDMKELPFWTTSIIRFLEAESLNADRPARRPLWNCWEKKKQNKAESKFQPTNKAKVKGFQLCINQSSCATSLSRGAWQHEYGLDSTEYLNAYALYFPMLKLSCITTAIFLFSNHTCSAFQSFRHCVAVASCRTPRTWKISMPSTWSCEEIVIQRSCEMMCCLAMFITGQRSTRTQSELTAQGILEAKNTSLKKKVMFESKGGKTKTQEIQQFNPLKREDIYSIYSEPHSI